MSRRIGVLGGMFDPVHTGHIEVALAAQSRLQLDEVRLVPCAIPNHKADATAGAMHRANMLRLAIDGLPGLLVDERELHREGTSYTVDTLAEMREIFTDASLVFIQGDDSFRTLPQWHQWRELLRFAHICVMSRKTQGHIQGHTQAQEQAQVSNEAYEPELAALLSEHGVDSVDALFAQRQGHVIQLDEVDNPVSSTQLREALLNRSFLTSQNAMLDPAVQSYIKQHNLYRSE